MKRRGWMMLICFGICAAGSLALAVEPNKVENPLYTRWAKFKPGTTVRIETKTENPAKTIEQTTIYKLVEINDSQLVVDMTIEIRDGGRKDTGPAQSFTHKRWFDLPKGMTAESLTKPRNVLEEGKEKITVAGREFDTIWYKSKAKVEAGDTFIKAWYSDAAPGGLVKEENETPNAKSKTKREIAEITEPK
jgi:hypothetical protein